MLKTSGKNYNMFGFNGNPAFLKSFNQPIARPNLFDNII